jgi:hypothetical protein
LPVSLVKPQLQSWFGAVARRYGFISRMGELIATLTSFTLSFQKAVYGADRAVINALVQQGGEDRSRRAIPRAFLKQTGEHRIRSARLRARAGGSLLPIV